MVSISTWRLFEPPHAKEGTRRSCWEQIPCPFTIAHHLSIFHTPRARTFPPSAHGVARADSPFRLYVFGNCWGLRSSRQTPIAFVQAHHLSVTCETSAVAA